MGSCIILSASVNPVEEFNKKPTYIEDAAKRKYGHNIHVIGATQEDINKFWKSVSYHALDSTLPVEVGRAVVDIDSKCHINESDGNDPGEGDKPYDWYDGFEIVSQKASRETSSKTYQLQLSSSTTRQFGGNLGVRVGGAGFFNMAGIAPSIGAGAHASKSKTTAVGQTDTVSSEQTLSQAYQIIDRLQVPPKTKVRALITTWAVTYESKTRTEVTVDADAKIRVRYRSRLSQCLCCFGGTKTNHVTAEDIFAGEEDYESEGGVVTFKRNGKVSYLGEEVEITKQKTPFNH